MYRQLENKIRIWAEIEPNVQALVVIGSRAREDHTPDQWSDLDLVLFVFDQTVLMQDNAWFARFGEVWLSRMQVTGSGFPEWLVIYKGGLKIDFLLAPASKALSEAL